MTLIDSFKGSHAFLSNFYTTPVQVKSILCQSAEHAYQACKTNDPAERDKILASKTSAGAKKLGSKAVLRPDWEDVKLSIMQFIIACKFPDIPEGAGKTHLSVRLWYTHPASLVEGNDWGDDFWGCVRPPDAQNGPWVGQNNLGVILTARRAQIGLAAGAVTS